MTRARLHRLTGALLVVCAAAWAMRGGFFAQFRSIGGALSLGVLLTFGGLLLWNPRGDLPRATWREQAASARGGEGSASG